MNKRNCFLPVFFAIVMMIFVLFTVWYLPSVHEVKFRILDLQKSLETSYGRERKQQAEYDAALAALPEVQAELDRLSPLNENAAQDVKNLKEERKKLRSEKKELENQASEHQGGD